MVKASWREIKFLLNEDLHACAGERWQERLGAFFFSLQFQALALHRLAQYLSGRRGWGVLGAIVAYLQQSLTGCYFHSTAEIGRGCRLPHPTGIVIGKGVVIGERVTLYQHVTLGSHGKPGEPPGYPQVGDGAVLYAGVVVAGAVKIGEGAVIGANSVVLEDVPAYAVAAGAPARVIRRREAGENG